MSRRIIVPVSIIAAMLCAMAGYSAAARANAPAQPAPKARPTAVAVVNMGRLLDGLNQWAQAKTALTALKDGVLAEANKRKAATDEKAKQLADVSGDQAVALQDKIDFETMTNRAWGDQVQDELDVEGSTRLQDIYRKIKAEAASLAQAQGYDIVMLDDSTGELQIDRESRLTRQSQIEQQILRRQLLYTNPEIDVTDDLIQRMNNAFKAP